MVDITFPGAENRNNGSLCQLPIYGQEIKADQCTWAGTNHTMTDSILNPVVSAFSDGQGEPGVEIAGLTIYNSGLPQLAQRYGWKCHDVECPLTGQEVPPKTDEDEYAVWGVKRCRAIGYKLGKLSATMQEQVKNHNGLLVNLGGDHSVAASSINAMLLKYPNLRVIWVDAHADCNTPQTSPSGNYHGMVLGHLMGWFEKKLPGFEWLRTDILKEKHVGYVGLRDVDGGERDHLHKSGCTYFSMQSLEEVNYGHAIDHLIQTLDPEGVHPFHISFDVDGADPSVAPGTGTLCEGGLTYSQSLRVVEKVARTGRLVSMDIVEVNVDKDKEEEPLHGDDPSIDSPYRTVKFALHLLRAAMGYVTL